MNGYGVAWSVVLGIYAAVCAGNGGVLWHWAPVPVFAGAALSFIVKAEADGDRRQARLNQARDDRDERLRHGLNKEEQELLTEYRKALPSRKQP